MSESNTIDPRQKIISLAVAILLVVGGTWLYGYMRHQWYENRERVVDRMYKDCTDSIENRIKTTNSTTPEQKAEFQNKGYQECQRIKESCTNDFNQQFCLFAQKIFQNPE